ncbi:EscU/YscU/HrcU family type III secretion system export apparatus switch protein, partial [Escherichia coli]|uniref:EscU/YscU/HrcU family type III secretion system export apparatus switch protein n=1 Tax=Escherichia coli TaxID=562 RepID=UPI00208DB046
SHEVANFARGIGMRLAFEMKEHIFGEIPTGIVVERDVPALLAAIGLAHDLGNPPFGHQGEAAMRAWFNKNLPGLLDKEVNSEIYNDFLQFDHSIINDPNLILGQIILLIREAMLALLPLISGVVLVALISPVMLGGLVFSGKSLQPKFSKLNPLPGIKRMFS